MSLGHEEGVLDRLSSNFKPESTPLNDLQELELKKARMLQEQSQKYIEDLLSQNSKQPVKIAELRVNNSQSFRQSFLNKQFEPLLSNPNTTLERFLKDIDKSTSNLVKLGIIENVQVQIHNLPKNFITRNSPAMDLIPIFQLFPTKQFFAKTGTNVGNGEGDGYIEFHYKNLFGGGENISFDATAGTRTRSSYLLNFNTPINNNANYLNENLFYVNSRKIDWAQHEQIIRGITNKVSTRFDNKSWNHELSVENYWRTITNVKSNSLSIINQSGDDFKSSIIYNVKYDSRDNLHLPTKGTSFKFGTEYSGLIPKLNKSMFLKNGYEFQYANKANKKLSFIFTSKGGLLYPFFNKNTHLMDRFYIGGPNDVRSFTLNGLGPKDYRSSLGGDIFFSNGISLFHHIPRTADDSNFKIHNFLNWGKLIPYDKDENVFNNLKSVLKAPSVSTGIGLVYNHPMARFELNFVLPLYVHEGDSIRKGLQYGIGLSFM